MTTRSLFRSLFQPLRKTNIFILFIAAMPLLVMFILIFIKPPHIYSNDLLSVAWRPGQELLSTGSVNPGYPYPLWTVIVMLPFSFLEKQAAMNIWLLCNLLMLALSFALLISNFDWEVNPVLFVMTVSLAGTFLPVLSSLGLGQITILSLLILALIIHFFLRKRWTWLGIMLGLTFIKPQVMPLLTGFLLLWALLNRRYQILLGFGSVLFVLVAISAPFASSPKQIIGGGIEDHLVNYIVRSSSIWGLLLNFGFSWVIPLVVSIALLLWLGWNWLPFLRGQEHSTNHPIFLFSAAVIINLIILPYSWIYNLVLLLLPFGYSLSLALKLKGKARAVWQILLFLVLQPLTIIVYLVFNGYSGTQAYQIIPALVLLLMMLYLEHKVNLAAV